VDDSAVGFNRIDIRANIDGTRTQPGIALTGPAGKVQFITIFPGWYEGRATHIHLRVRSQYSAASSARGEVNTTQVFFPQATINTVTTKVAPYNSRGASFTTNAGDHVYTMQTEGKMELALMGDARSGYRADVTIGLPIISV
jgi:protocatechuate 3,4-dioxygenase beta subunit